IGGTRARIMVSLRAARSTSELAEAIGMSLASASQQVTVLRDAGLATSRRDGRSVRHTLTQQGRSLLEGR
ncbi:MAG TPA: helix-turn-helix domain-containing protein, partial [Pseudonocardiaceae bacterium]